MTNTSAPDDLDHLLRRLTSNKVTLPESAQWALLNQPWAHGHTWTAEGVVHRDPGNQHTPGDELRYRLANNPSALPQVLGCLAQDPVPHVARAALTHPECPRQAQLDAAAVSNDPVVLGAALAACDHPEVLDAIVARICRELSEGGDQQPQGGLDSEELVTALLVNPVLGAQTALTLMTAVLVGPRPEEHIGAVSVHLASHLDRLDALVAALCHSELSTSALTWVIAELALMELRSHPQPLPLSAATWELVWRRCVQQRLDHAAAFGQLADGHLPDRIATFLASLGALPKESQQRLARLLEQRRPGPDHVETLAAMCHPRRRSLDDRLALSFGDPGVGHDERRAVLDELLGDLDVGRVRHLSFETLVAVIADPVVSTREALTLWREPGSPTMTHDCQRLAAARSFDEQFCAQLVAQDLFAVRGCARPAHMLCQELARRVRSSRIAVVPAGLLDLLVHEVDQLSWRLVVELSGISGTLDEAVLGVLGEVLAKPVSAKILASLSQDFEGTLSELVATCEDLAE